MKIALYHNLPSGGARRAMVEMVKGLAARGHTVDEYCPETADLSFLPLDGYVRRTVVLPFRPLGVARRRVPMLTPYITAARLVYDLRAMVGVGQQAARHIGSQDYDVVFSHDCQLALVPDLLRFLQQPAVHYWHIGARGLVAEWQPSDPGARLPERLKGAYYAPARSIYPWLRRRQTQRNLRAAGQVLTNSSFAAAELHQAFGVTSEVCYLGVDVARFRPLDVPRQRFVLSVGAVHYRKGHRFLVRALSRIPGERRPCLVIAANGADPAEQVVVEALARRHGVSLSIVATTNDEELVHLYNRAAAFVYAPIMEPWGLAAVEAMACGTPVVAVAEGGVRESVIHTETGWLVERDETEFARALEHILESRSLRERLSAHAVEHVGAHYTWTQTLARLAEVLLRVAGSSRIVASQEKTDVPA